MSATDVVHYKVTLAEDLRDRTFRRMMQGYVESERGEHPNDGLGSLAGGLSESVFGPQDTGISVCEDMERALQASESFYIAPNMCELAMAASQNMPDEPLLPMDLPSPQGFMWFAQPYRINDVRRKLLSMNAIMWSIRGGTVRVWHFTHKDDPLDSVNITARENVGADNYSRMMPTLSLNHIFDLKVGGELPRSLSWPTAVPPEALTSITRLDDGSYKFVSDVGFTEQPEAVRSPLSAFLLTIWRLCQQTLAVREREPLTRANRRRLQRANLPDSPVSVIMLRRRSIGDDESHGDVEWTHRWVVRGHWRKQPCKENGEWTHRYVYINPYIKGPEDKPILVREHVNALYR